MAQKEIRLQRNYLHCKDALNHDDVESERPKNHPLHASLVRWCGETQRMVAFKVNFISLQPNLDDIFTIIIA